MIRTVRQICHVDTCTREGCSPENGCQGHVAREQAPENFLARAQHLVAEAAKLGVIITVEQRPLLPLAMGNHETVVSVRVARVMAAPK